MTRSRLEQRVRELALAHGYTQQNETPQHFDPPSQRVVGDAVATSFPLRWHVDERGSLVELLRGSWVSRYSGDVDEQFDFDFAGQAYVSTTLPGIVKGWHLHAKQCDRFVVLRGRVLLGLCDLTSGNTARVVLDSQRDARCVLVPPGVAHGWKAIGSDESFVLNLCSHEYDGTDEFRRDPHAGPSSLLDVAFDWNAGVDG